jgi:hypothetical protein
VNRDRWDFIGAELGEQVVHVRIRNLEPVRRAYPQQHFGMFGRTLQRRVIYFVLLQRLNVVV